MFLFWLSVTSNGSPYAMGPFSCLSLCLSVTLVYCGQTAGWIRILGTEVGLGPGDIVLDGDPAPPGKGGAQQPPPVFGPCLLWPNGRPSQQLLSCCSTMYVRYDVFCCLSSPLC